MSDYGTNDVVRYRTPDHEGIGVVERIDRRGHLWVRPKPGRPQPTLIFATEVIETIGSNHPAHLQ